MSFGYDDPVGARATAPLRQLVAWKTIHVTEDRDTVLTENEDPLVEISSSAQHRQWVMFTDPWALTH